MNTDMNRTDMNNGDLPKGALSADDPRITAYLLGELEGADREIVERALALNPELLSLSDELHNTASLLESGLRTESAPALNPLQREQIDRAAQPTVLRLMPSVRAAIAATILGGASYVLASFEPEVVSESVATAFDTGVEPFYADTSVVYRYSLGSEGASRPAPTGAVGGLTAGGGVYRGPGDSSPPSRHRSRALGIGGGAGGGPVSPKQSGPSSPGPSSPGPAKSVKRSLRLSKPMDARAYNRVGGRDRAGLPALREVRRVLASEEHPKLRFEFNEALVEQEPAETYAAPPENPFILTGEDPMSTFSIDVDTASYTNTRRHLTNGQLPPSNSVRMEEFINYFRYSDAAPIGNVPFSVSTEVASCPWQPRHQLVRVGLKGKDVLWSQRPASNLVFLLDVSGSMNSESKLPLLVRSLKLLIEQLDSRDSVAIVVYAGASGLVLPATPGNQHVDIMNSLDKLKAGGSTNGGAGIELAYKIAADRYIEGGLNRVILATDGDFNVGVSSRDDLVKLIEEKRETGVFLSVFGFGSGNLNDDGMEQLADKGNGAYSYIDSIDEGRRVLVEEVGGTMMTIAKDVKIQVAFNPSAVRAWRLLGYENRLLAHQDFDDDTKDAGEIGAGVTCTAIYEVVPAVQPLPPGMESRPTSTFPLPGMARNMPYDELMLLRLRYKEPSSDRSLLLESKVRDSQAPWHAASQDLRFATAVAGFAMLLKGSSHGGTLSFDEVFNMGYQARGDDLGGYRMQFLELVKAAKKLKEEQVAMQIAEEKQAALDAASDNQDR